MPANRAELIATYREHFPELKGLPDNDVFRVIAVSDPELAQASAKAMETPVQPQPYVGRGAGGIETMQDQAAQVLQGIPQAVTGIPGAIKGIGGMLWDAVSGNAGKAGSDLWGAAKAAASPVTMPLQGIGALLAPKSIAGPSDEQWQQSAQGAGAMLGGAALSYGGSKLASALASKLPSKTAAGAKFATVMQGAKDIPIDTTQVGNAVLRADELAKTGSSLPKVLRDYMKYPAGQDMPYEVGRDFAVKSGALSAIEKEAIDRPMARQLAKFADALKEANRGAAEQAGLGSVYDAAIKEYRQASTIANAAEIAKKWAVRAAIAGGLGAAGKAGYDIYSGATK